MCIRIYIFGEHDFLLNIFISDTVGHSTGPTERWKMVEDGGKWWKMVEY